MKNTGKNNYFFLLVSFVVPALLACAPTYAQDKTAEVDKIFSWTKPNEPGCAVAVSQDGKLVVNKAYGSADLERDVPLSANSVFDAGSVRKQFVAAAILLLLQFLSADQFEIKTKDGVTTRYRRAVGYTPTADDLKAFAGRYYSHELMAAFEATPGKDGLMVRANDAPRALLEFKTVARDTFQIGGSLLRFTRDKAGKVVGLQYSNLLLRNVKFTRLSDC